MAQFLNYDPDEEAFIIGHEIGHVQDWANCAALKVARMNRAPILKQLALTGARQACEENADNYGLQYMWGAGYNPFAAGALFGRLEMYAPNETRGMASMLNNFLSDHPISSERIRKLRAVVAQLCSQQGTVCRPWDGSWNSACMFRSTSDAYVADAHPGASSFVSTNSSMK
jgi:predicted Zn-dependent protease